jgi:nucleotide-binding universal stress UspA family protein
MLGPIAANQFVIESQGTLRESWNVLVPILRAQAAGPLIEIGDALAGQVGSQGQVLGLVEVPSGRIGGLREEVTERQRELLRWIAATDQPLLSGQGPRLGVLVRVTHSAALGVREAIYENGADTVVIEWPGLGSRRPRALGSVLRDLVADPPADLLLVRPHPGGLRRADTPPRILVPVRGGSNAQLAIQVGAALGEFWGGRLTVLQVLGSRDGLAEERPDEEVVRQLLRYAGEPAVDVCRRQSDDVAGAILEESENRDVVILGTAVDQRPSASLVSPQMARMVRRLEGTVILVRTVASMLRAATAH